MPFLAPALPALIGTGISAIGGLFGGKGGSSGSAAGVSSNDLANFSKEAMTINPYSKQATGDIAPVTQYYKTALGGNEGALRDLLGPEVSTVMGQYDTAAKTSAELGPRGGGRNAIMAEAPFQKAAAYGKALAGARTGAATGLLQAGQAEGQIAAGETAARNQVLSTLTQAQEEANKRRSSLFGQIGSGLGSIFAPGLSKLFGGGGSPSVPLSNPGAYSPPLTDIYPGG